MKLNEKPGTYAIINKRTGMFLTGTDYRTEPWTQLTYGWQPPCLYAYESKAEDDLIDRRCGPDYEVVEVKLKVKRR
ncbi:hypothetical protein [Jeotgalibacillus haloalkalitolerans]|uniref:Uncharacterized protein n=1 Tax=Jeotgalibacillus haloalkalitolerans TaxID=3104292 RepID=A0ABU5KL26_9BACL|nr:hypothetical protein [Jeotgalibacillus sp. HH7-29]MDZ5711641.1 hypothetical protein [Jeotgalibacillus sp. HH7-29]